MQDDIKVGVLTRDKFDQALFDTFLQERVVEAKIRVWSPMKKANLKYWKSAGQTIKNKTTSGIAPFKDDKSSLCTFFQDVIRQALSVGKAKRLVRIHLRTPKDQYSVPSLAWEAATPSQKIYI